VIAWLLARPRLLAYGLAGAALVGALAWAGLTVRGWHRDSLALPVARRERDEARAIAETAKQEASRNAAITNDLRDKTDALRADLRARPITVRVCPPSPPVLPARATGGTDAPAAGPVAREAAEDGQTVDLSAYAEDAAACADQLRALQGWVRERP